MRAVAKRFVLGVTTSAEGVIALNGIALALLPAVALIFTINAYVLVREWNSARYEVRTVFGDFDSLWCLRHWLFPGLGTSKRF
jgi:hypothetical protein